MKRKIKFRGRDINTGEVIFGDLRHIGIRTYIFKEAQCYYDEELIEVDEDSIAQLVGFDRDGREVYEGDIVADDIAEYVTHLFPNIRISECKLKEEPKP